MVLRREASAYFGLKSCSGVERLQILVGQRAEQTKTRFPRLFFFSACCRACAGKILQTRKRCSKMLLRCEVSAYVGQESRSYLERPQVLVGQAEHFFLFCFVCCRACAK